MRQIILKINAKTLATFLSKVTINGSMQDALLNFGPEGLSVSVKDISATGFASGLLKITSGFIDYAQFEAPVKNIPKVLSFLKNINGNVEISIEGNNLLLKSDSNDGRFKLSEVQYLECNLQKFPVLADHDAGFEVDTKVLDSAKKNASNLGFKFVSAECKGGVFYLTAGEDEFDQLTAHIPADYKDVEKTMYASVLLEFISVIDGKAIVTFNKDYPMMITVLTQDATYKWLVAPMSRPEEQADTEQNTFIIFFVGDNMSTQLLVEKYRPRVIEDIVGLDTTKLNFDQTLPHLFLYGPPGTGKTTLAKAIIRKLDCDFITLNASDERGIDTIRDRVKAFASTQSTKPTIKIVFLDESDHLTPDAQATLRNIMESYATTCRFILTANYPNRIIDPLKSRCLSIPFNNINPGDIVKRLELICKQEKIPYDGKALEKIVQINGSDIRRSINKLEELRSGVTLDKVKSEALVSQLVWSAIKSQDFGKARQTYLDSHQEPEQFIKDLHDTIWESDSDSDYKKHAILEIADHYKFLSSVAWKEILIESLILKLIENMIQVGWNTFENFKALKAGKLEHVSDTMLYPLLRWCSGSLDDLAWCNEVNKRFFYVPKNIQKTLLYVGLNKKSGFAKYPKASKEVLTKQLELKKLLAKQYFGWSEQEFTRNLTNLDHIDWSVILKSLGCDNSNYKLLGIKYDSDKILSKTKSKTKPSCSLSDFR